MADTNWWGVSWSRAWGDSWSLLDASQNTQPVYGEPFITGRCTLTPTLSFTAAISPTLSFYTAFEESD